MCSVCQSNFTDAAWTCMTDPPPGENCTSTCLRRLPDGTCIGYIHYPYCVTVKKFDENSKSIKSATFDVKIPKLYLSNLIYRKLIYMN